MPDEPAPAASPEGLPTSGGETPPVSKSNSSWPRVLALVVALALVGGGVGAAITLSSSPPGAASPSAAVGDLLGAADHVDLLGVLDAIVPGERQVIEPGITGLAHQFERLTILSSGTNLAAISGLGLHFSGITTTTQALSSDLVAVTITSGRVTESVNPSKLPVGSFVSSLAGSSLQGGERSATTAIKSEASTPIVTEKVGGRWYVSLGYTIIVDALKAKGGTGAPPSATSAIRPSGGNSADDAVRAFISDVTAFNVSGVLADLAPGEMGALQTYAPEILGRAQSELEKARSEVHLKITSMMLSDSPVTGGTLVKVGDLGLSASVRGITIGIKGGCVSVTTPAGTTNRCPSSAAKPGEEQRILSVLPPSLRPLTSRLFTMHPAIGIVAVNQDGAWFVSPTATVFYDIDAALSILQPQDLRAIATLARHPAEARALERALERLASSSVTNGGGLF